MGDKTFYFWYQKDRASSRSVSVYPYLCYDASPAHRRGRGDKEKIDIFSLVTRRPSAHSGRCVYNQN